MLNAVDWDSLSFKVTFGIISFATIFFLLFPSILILMLSFTGEDVLRFPPRSYSFKWYRALLDANEIGDAVWISLQVSIMTVIASVVLGVSAALAISKSSSGWATALDTLFMSPLILPALAFGFAALMMFSSLGIRPSIATLTIGHVVVSVPFVIRTTLANLSQLDPALIESSRSLGASSAYTFWRITLPLISPGVMAGAFIAFMASFDNVPVSLFLQDARTQVLPIHLWDIIQNSLDSRAASASGAIIIVTLAMMLLMERLAGFSRFMR